MSPQKVNASTIFCTPTKKQPPGNSADIFGMVKPCPFLKVVSDLQLGDQRVTLNRLACAIFLECRPLEGVSYDCGGQI